MPRTPVPAQREQIAAIAGFIQQSIERHPKGFRLQPDETHHAFAERLIRLREQGKCAELLYLPGETPGEVIAAGGVDPEGMRKTAAAMLQAVGGSPNAATEAQETIVPEIARLHVSHTEQGKGYGKMMLSALVAAAHEKKAQAVQLHVTRTQAPAMGLYTKAGFIDATEEAAKVWSAKAPKDETGALVFSCSDGKEYPTRFFAKALRSGSPSRPAPKTGESERPQAAARLR